MPGVVAERECGVARELGLRPVPRPLVDQGWHRNGDPLLARLEATSGRGGRAWTALDGRLGRRHVGVAVGVGGSGVDRVGQDVMDRGGRPGGAAGARPVGAGIEAFDDLANGCLLVGEPVIHPAYQFGLWLVDSDVAGHGVAPRDITVSIRRASGDVVAVAGFLQLAAAEPLAEHRALIFGNRALDLQQELVVGVVRDRVLQKHHLGACATELLEQQHLVGILARQAVRGQHDQRAYGTVAHGVAQRVEAGPVEPAAAVTFITENLFVTYRIALRGGPGSQGGELAVDGLLAFLAFG